MTTLETLWARGRELLGCEYAMMGGAMSWVSERNLVAALSNAGAFGVLAASSMPPELLHKEIIATQQLTQKPFGVNLILMHPQLEQLVETCVTNKVTHVVLAGGIPKAPTINRLKEGGAKVIGFAPTATIGKKLVRMGVDALVIEGTEAGGHIGPVSTSVLAQEILPVIRDVPVFVAGGIGRGGGLRRRLGARGIGGEVPAGQQPLTDNAQIGIALPDSYCIAKPEMKTRSTNALRTEGTEPHQRG
jgi:enoyl-[acyl-carrier protein] reductase II